MTSTILKTQHLTRKLTGEVPVTLVEDISLEIHQGQLVVISGPSGSGKSSLLYLLGLLDTPTSGKLWLRDTETSEFSEEELANIRLAEMGFVFQFHFLLPEFTALENVMLPMQRLGRLTSQEIRQRAESLLDDLGLADQREKLPRQMSGGQSQRVAIARALANEPVLILADEPTGNLDTKSSNNVQKILKELAHTHNRTIISVTHDPKFASIADHTISIVDGKIRV